MLYQDLGKLPLPPVAIGMMLILIVLMFAFVDKDGDGLISIGEIRDACAVDRDGDGAISESEKNIAIANTIQTLASWNGIREDQKFSLRDIATCFAKAAAVTKTKSS